MIRGSVRRRASGGSRFCHWSVGLKLLGAIESASLALGIGDNAARERCFERLRSNGIRISTVVHPRASVSRSAQLGEGTVVMAGAVVNPDARCGHGAIVNSGAVVEHDCILGAFVHVSPNAALGGNVAIGDRSHVGLGASVIPGTRIGRDVRVGAGAAVVRDVADGQTVVGVPARPLRKEGLPLSSIHPRIYLSPPHMGEDERRLLLEAFDSNWIAPLGPHVDAFEREFAEKVGAAHAVALSSGTAALHLAMLMLGVSRDDEVIVSSLTFSATANPVTYLGARPVFIDSDAKTWNMDPGLLARSSKACADRGRLPKAVIAVDLYGQCADYDRIREACARYDVPLIEDAAEALGATYRGRPAGTFGAMGVFSFNGNKIITTSGGGMLVSDRKEWIDRARFLSTQARDPAPHYQHSQIGYNYRMSNLLAAVGRGQLAGSR